MVAPPMAYGRGRSYAFLVWLYSGSVGAEGCRMRGLFGLIAGAVLLAGCAPAARNLSDAALNRPSAPKRVVLAIINEPVAFSQQLTPATISASANSLLNFIHPGLTVTDNSGVYHPALAEAVPT